MIWPYVWVRLIFPQKEIRHVLLVDPIARFFVISNILSILYTIWRIIAICRNMNINIFSCRFWSTMAREEPPLFLCILLPNIWAAPLVENSCITSRPELQCDQPETQNASRPGPVKSHRFEAGSVFDHIDYHRQFRNTWKYGFKSAKEYLKPNRNS